VVITTSLAAVVASLIALTAAVRARSSLERGTSLLASVALTAQAPSDRDTASTTLVASAREFRKARGLLESWLVRPAAAVPIVAQHWRALNAAAISGDELAKAGSRALRSPAARSVVISNGQIPLDQLAAVGLPLRNVAERLEAATRRLGAARSPWLLPELNGRLAREVGRLVPAEKAARSASDAIPQLPGILGAQGLRRYFLAVQTPAEGRGTGGFIGNFGEIIADNGTLSLSRFGRIGELGPPEGSPPLKLLGPADYVARYSRFHIPPDWRNVNVTPDFPTAAQVIAGFYPQSGGQPIDGVIAVDPTGLAKLLELVGPISVPAWPTPITPENATQVLLRDQYLRFDNPERVDFLGSVAQEVWSRLTSGPLPPVPVLMAVLGSATRDKHLMVASTRPAEEGLYERVGAAGKMAPVTGDFLGVITQNAGGSKLDAFLTRTIEYQVELNPGTGRLIAHATIILRNDAPATGLPGSVLGTDYFPELPPASDRLYLSVYTPWQLSGTTLDGRQAAFEVDKELGRRVYSGAVVVPAGGTVSVQMTFAGQLRSSEKYRLDLHRQPTAAADRVSIIVGASRGWNLDGGESRWHDQFDMNADRAVNLSFRRG